MELPQRNSQCGYLKQTKLSFFSSFLIQNWRSGIWKGPECKWEGGGGREMVWEGECGANAMYTCT
jgi:hypothetical protein